MQILIRQDLDINIMIIIGMIKQHKNKEKCQPHLLYIIFKVPHIYKYIRLKIHTNEGLSSFDQSSHITYFVLSAGLRLYSRFCYEE